MAPLKTWFTIIIGVVFETKWNMTWDKEIVKQEQLNSTETQYFCHADTVNNK